MGQIVGYQHTGPTAVFTFETPTTEAEPFGGSPPQDNEPVAILNPDPFDSRGVYPSYAYTETKTPNFGLVPLIYSAGPDRLYGIISTTTPVLEYSIGAKLNPCHVNAGGALIGEPTEGHFDNITSHQVTTR